ncbi:MAG: hypothetical protein Q8N59_03405 [bacterium]|nr:hypothetical protein [bacterium]
MGNLKQRLLGDTAREIKVKEGEIIKSNEELKVLSYRERVINKFEDGEL